MKTSLIGLFLLFSFFLSAQEYKDSLSFAPDFPPIQKTYNEVLSDSFKLSIPEYSPYSTGIPPLSLASLTSISVEPDPFKEIRMSAHVPIRYSDYQYSNVYGLMELDNNLWLSTARTNDFYYGLGIVRSAQASLNFNIEDFGVLSLGSYITKYNVAHSFHNGAGVNANLRIPIGDRIFLNTFGQYSTNDNKDKINPYSMMYPTTNFGGSVEFKVTDKWGINAGMIREWEFDPWRGSGRWVNRPFITPVFY